MIVVYGMKNGVPDAHVFSDSELNVALNCSAVLRKTHANVCLSSEPTGMVGDFGVTSVEDGVLPDGHRYEWSKAHRAGMRTPKS